MGLAVTGDKSPPGLYFLCKSHKKRGMLIDQHSSFSLYFTERGKQCGKTLRTEQS